MDTVRSGETSAARGVPAVAAERGPLPSAALRARAVVVTVVGNALEWFDFAAYAFFAAVIGRHFFPPGNDAVVLLSTFAVFGVGFVARPLGAVAFGRLGDTRGRKLALLVSIPLMGLGTLLVGVSPSYASIGIAAPILLVVGRLLQGFSAGGELGNAVAFLVEWAPTHRRGLYSSLQQGSVILGTLLGSGSAALLTSVLAPESLDSWGWRLPFLVGGLIIAPLGLFLRRHVEESPEFEETVTEHREPPRRSVSSWRLGLKTIAVTSAWVVSYYVFLIFLPSFLPKYAGMSASSALWASTLGLAAMMVTIPLAGHLSDRVGRRPPLLVAAAVCIVAPYPVFVLLVGGAPLWQVLLVLVGAGAVVGVLGGIGPVVMSEMFPTGVRTTGVAVSFGLATAVLGGFAPFVSTWLIGVTGSPVSPTFLVIAAGSVSTVAVLTLRETAHDPLPK